MTTVLQTKDLVYGFDTLALNEDAPLSMSIKRGDVVGLVGNNGVGKTCLLSTLCDAIPPISGTVSSKTKPVFGNATLDHFENLAPRRVIGKLSSFAPNVSQAYQMPLAVIQELGKLDVAPRTWNGGARRLYRVCLAAMMSQSVCLFDEPFEGLDSESADCVARTIAKLSEDGIAVVLSNHRTDFSKYLTSTIAL